MKKINTHDIYNSCSGKKGSSCDSIDYVLPYFEQSDTILGSCGGAGCAYQVRILPKGIKKLIVK